MTFEVNKDVEILDPKHALIFNFLFILETLRTKSKDQGGGRHMKFLTFGTSLHKLGHPTVPMSTEKNTT